MSSERERKTPSEIREQLNDIGKRIVDELDVHNDDRLEAITKIMHELESVLESARVGKVMVTRGENPYRALIRAEGEDGNAYQLAHSTRGCPVVYSEQNAQLFHLSWQDILYLARLAGLDEKKIILDESDG